MKQIIWKAYMDFEKEERWLNKMASLGLSMSDYSWCRYAFDETKKNEYAYRIELLKNSASHPESIAYIRFLEENGVECIATYWRWIYLRKKTSEGHFDIYTDIESKIRHYKRVFWFETVFMSVELSIAVFNLAIGVENLSTGNFNFSNIIMGGALAFLGLLFMKLSLSMRRKIKNLSKEKLIRE